MMKLVNSFNENTQTNDFEKFSDGKSKVLLKYNLSFFDDNSAGEKTEKPTQKRKNKSRDEGSVAKSPEITTAIMFILMFNLIKVFGPYIFKGLFEIYNISMDWLVDIDNPINADFTYDLAIFLFQKVLLLLAPILIFTMVIGIVVNLFQVGWHPTLKPLEPKLTKLNPVSGFKKLFSIKQLVELFKSLLKLFLIGFAIYNVLEEELYMINNLYNMGLLEAFIYIADLTVGLGIYIGQLYIIIAVIDYGYIKYKHDKDLKMSKQDIKDEYKQSEGDPHIKGKIRQKMREVSMRRMMQNIPAADVIITNPTHYAVAIKYDRENKGAPIVVAKGVDHLAQKIKEKAKENKIEVVENKQVARSLYNLVEVGHEIPPELYQAVAEILAFVYKLKHAV